jgi:hypothetical protein
VSAQPHPRLPLAASRSALDAFARFAPNKVLENEVESSIRAGRISGASTVYVDGPAATHESVPTRSICGSRHSGTRSRQTRRPRRPQARRAAAAQSRD